MPTVVNCVIKGLGLIITPLVGIYNALQDDSDHLAKKSAFDYLDHKFSKIVVFNYFVLKKYIKIFFGWLPFSYYKRIEITNNNINIV